MKAIATMCFMAILITDMQGQSQSAPLLLKSRVINPKHNVEEFIRSIEISGSEIAAGYYYRLIQFNEIPKQETREEFENLGVKILGYIPHNAYITAIPQNFDKTVFANFNIKSIMSVKPEYKIHPSIAGEDLPEWAIKHPGTIDVIVQYFSTISAEIAIRKMQEQGAVFLSRDDYTQLITIRIPKNEIEKFADLPHLLYMEAIPPPAVPEDTEGRSLHRSNMIFTDYAGGRKYDGTGVNIAINDDGFVGPHIDFTGRTDQTDVAGDFIGSHGDMTTGIAGGAGNLDPTIVGMAPGAFLYVRQYNNTLPNTVSLHNSDTIMLFSSSYSNGCNAGYTSTTQKVDQEIYNNPSLIQVFSGGNSNNQDCGYGAGTQFGNVTGGHKIAKNVIATANVFANDNIANSSSRGPASDGRLKPDISANGQDQMSTDPDNAYAFGGGTSAAAPGISGIMAQLYHAYRELNGGTNPESSLLKACLLNTADDLGNPGPDFTFGWGRVNAARALEILENVTYTSSTISQAGTNNHVIIVPSGTAQLRVMLYWMEPEASTLSSKALINDLDLVITDPVNTVIEPWVLDPTPNPTNLSADAVRGIDTLNNVEQVTIDNPATGGYLVTVSGTGVPMGPQKYYIVHEFVTSDVKVTYPLGGEGLAPGDITRIRWDAFEDNGGFDLEYSTDNGVIWNNIVSNLNAAARFYDWSVPNAFTGEALVQITRGASSDVSDANFSITPIPQNLTIDSACPSSFQLSWDPVSGATSYEASILGTKYMDAAGTTTNTFFEFTGVNSTVEQWVSVKAFGPQNAKGRRALAIQKAPGLVNCVLPIDVILSEIISPASGKSFNCLSSAQENVTIKIKSNGTNSVSNIPVNYQLNGGTVVSETYTGTLGSGDSVNYTFSQQIDFSASGTYNLLCWSEMPGDGDLYSDTATAISQIITGTVQGFPWSENFELFSNCSTDSDCGAINCSLGNGWLNQTNSEDDDIDWRTNNGSTPSNNTGPSVDHTLGDTLGKYLYLEASGGCNFMVAEAVTPCIDLTSGKNAQLSFWYHMLGSDMGELHVDVADGLTWNLDVTSPISGNFGNTWIQGLVDLSSFWGRMIAVRFRGITGPNFESDIAIDDIMLTADSIFSSVSGLNNQIDMHVFPNPGNGKFNLHLSGMIAGDLSIEVSNLLGKTVHYEAFSNVSDRFQSEIDLSALASGTYFLRATSLQGMKVIKLVIE